VRQRSLLHGACAGGAPLPAGTRGWGSTFFRGVPCPTTHAANTLHDEMGWEVHLACPVRRWHSCALRALPPHALAAHLSQPQRAPPGRKATWSAPHALAGSWSWLSAGRRRCTAGALASLGPWRSPRCVGGQPAARWAPVMGADTCAAHPHAQRSHRRVVSVLRAG
jgi:hypothetical protein